MWREGGMSFLVRLSGTALWMAAMILAILGGTVMLIVGLASCVAGYPLPGVGLILATPLLMATCMYVTTVGERLEQFR
jgi:hypothetical protein